MVGSLPCVHRFSVEYVAQSSGSPAVFVRHIGSNVADKLPGIPRVGPL